MNWSRTHTLVAGIGLIVAVNAVALLGVVWNRSGEPESSLQLSQRELSLPYGWNQNNEDSGLHLELRWRVLAAEDGSDTWLWSTYVTPEWLDEGKMTSLGFLPTVENPLGEQMVSERDMLPRDVFLVLELDGPSYQAALIRITKYAERRQGDEEALKHLEAERTEKSRLFVVDAGLNSVALRTRYPERNRYAVVRGQIERRSGGSEDRSGLVSQVNVASINVPLQWRSVFGPIAPEFLRSTDTPDAFQVQVDFGKRLEPWIAHAERLQP